MHPTLAQGSPRNYTVSTGMKDMILLFKLISYFVTFSWMLAGDMRLLGKRHKVFSLPTRRM